MKNSPTSIMPSVIINLSGLNSGGGTAIAEGFVKNYIHCFPNTDLTIICQAGALLKTGISKSLILKLPRPFGILSDQVFMAILLAFFSLSRKKIILLNFSDIPIATNVNQIMFFDWAYAVTLESEWGHMSKREKYVKIVKRFVFWRMTRFVNYYICQNTYMKNCLVNCGLESHKIGINPIAIGSVLETSSSIPESKLISTIEAAKKVFRHIVFCPNTYNSHKGFDQIAWLISSGLLQRYNLALVLLATRDLAKSLVSKLAWDNYSKYIITLGSVNKNEMIFLYKCASLIINPSQIESFGFTYYEAALYGVRQVVPDLPHIPSFASTYSYSNRDYNCMKTSIVNAIKDYESAGPLDQQQFSDYLSTSSRNSVNSLADLIRSWI
jgi:hypothetical protein